SHASCKHVSSASRNKSALFLDSRPSTIITVDILPSVMPKSNDRLELLQGTLDMLILKTLLFGPAHGHGIAAYIRQTTGDTLVVEHGSLYPALHRLQRDGFIGAKWEKAAGSNRE